MLLNPPDEIARRAKPQLVSFLQNMHLMLSMTSINAMMLVNNVAQHRLSPQVLRLRSRRSDTRVEDEWDLALAVITPGCKVALFVDLRQLRQHRQTINAQVGHRNNRLGCATKRDK